MTTPRHILITLALLLTVASGALADDAGKKHAQKLLSEGNQLLASGDHQAALVKFQAAYDAYPSPSLLLNIGTTLRGLGRNVEAANAYARWIRAKQNPERLAEVEEALAELDKMVAMIEIAVSEAGAAVSIDGRAISASELGGVIRVEPGARTVVATKAGFERASEVVTTVIGKKTTARLVLQKVQSAVDERPDDVAPVAPPPTDSNSGGGGLRIAGLSIAGIGVVGVGVGVAFGLQARSLSNELDEEAERLAVAGEPWTAELLAKEDDGKSAQTKMIVFSAVGAAAIIGGSVLYILGRQGGNETEPGLAITPSLGPDMMGWALSGAF